MEQGNFVFVSQLSMFQYIAEFGSLNSQIFEWIKAKKSIYF